MRHSWSARAACRDADSSIFYPTSGFSDAQAKVYCNVCPCREACLEYALENGEWLGVWGGMNIEERRAIARNRSRGA